MAHYVPKYRGATFTTAKVIGADMLNFKLIFNPLFEKKIVRGTPVLNGECANKR